VATERYLLLCRDAVMDSPAMQQVVAALRDPALRAQLAALPGYDPAAAGTVMPLVQAYPALRA
jgi:molybdate-binding protein